MPEYKSYAVRDILVGWRLRTDAFQPIKVESKTWLDGQVQLGLKYNNGETAEEMHKPDSGLLVEVTYNGIIATPCTHMLGTECPRPISSSSSWEKTEPIRRGRPWFDYLHPKPETVEEPMQESAP